MDSKSQYYLKILETIGSPLLRSVLAAANADGAGDEKAAQELASLLSRSVQLSIQMGQDFDFSKGSDQGDALRVALAALAAPIVAESYSRTGKALSEQESAKIAGVLNSVLTFSDNFAPGEEAADRLSNLKADGAPVDGAQADIQYMDAFLPIVQEIAEFSFGQQESKIALDVADKLVKRAVEIREARLPSLPDADAQKRAEVAILRNLAQLFASCYRATVQSLSGAAESGGDVPGIEAVWEAFDKQSALLDLMVASLLDDQAQGQGQSAGGASAVQPAQAQEAQPQQAQEPASPPPPPAQEAPAEPPAPVEIPKEPEGGSEAPPQKPAIFSGMPQASEPKPEEPAAAEPETPAAPLQEEQPSAPQPPPQEEKQAAPAGGANPMAMFAKPKEESSDGGSAAASEPAQPVQPEPEQTPPAEEAPPEQPPPAAPPPAQEPEETKDEGGDSGQEGNPMSFFKSGG